MLSRFINRFKRNDLDEQRRFQSSVLAVVREQYPGRSWSLADDPLVLLLNGDPVGLTNLRSTFLLTNGSDDDLVELVKNHFDKIAPGIEAALQGTPSWEAARDRIMPQLFPVDFLEKLSLVHCPFGGGIVAGFVIDSEQTYSYVTADNLALWQIDAEELRHTASENLDRRTSGIEAIGIPGENALYVINSMDSFDAARILSARVRGSCAEVVAVPFYFGVPNRDFLICWKLNDDSDFQSKMRLQVAADCERQPYPLSPATFLMEEDGTVREAETPTIDPRSLSADRN